VVAVMLRVVVVVLVRGMSVGTNVGTAKIGWCGCFPELVQVVGIAMIAIKVYAQMVKSFSTCCVCGQKVPEFD
jgi:hypothetical protein